MAYFHKTWVDNDKLEVKTYKGSCHCKRFEFEFPYPTLGQADGPKPLSCNCTICHERGYVLVFTPPDALKMIKGDEKDLSIYQYHNKVCDHKFCPTCGSGIIERIPSMDACAVNLRAVKEPLVDYETLKTTETQFFNGQSL